MSDVPTEIDPYEQFFGLNDAPFSLAPNPAYLFESASHAAALAQVAYALERREPLIVITGDIGTGKTLLCRTVLQRVPGQTFISIINNPLLERDDLLKQLLQDFGVISKDRTIVAPTTRHDLIHALEDFLASLIELQAHAVVIIDEAQHIQPDVLEQIRLLSNIDEARGTMLQIILVGQKDLEALLSRPELRQFQQRVSRWIRLDALTAEELPQYVEHRLAVAQAATASTLPGANELARVLADWEPGTGVTFSPDAYEAIWRTSGGLPRVVNLLCDRAMEDAYSRRVHLIDAASINTAALALDRKGTPAPVDLWSAPGLVEAGDETVAVAAAPASAAAASRRKKLIALTAAVALLVVAVVFGAQAWNQHLDRLRAAPQQSPVAVHTPPVVRSTPPPSPPASGPEASGSVLSTASAPAAPSPPASASGASPAPTVSKPASTGPAAATIATAGEVAGRFEIVVGSFKSESRATEVATMVTAAGLSARQRATGGWQQVIAGPFASRDEADKAQQRLRNAGFTGTQTVAAGR